jgi:dihydropteroate synthase
MQTLTNYEHIINEVYTYYSERIQLAKQHHIMDVIIDPGFGFAKTLSQNYELLGKLEFFQNLNCPILCGVSRKSMIYKILNCTPKEALNGTTALNMLSLMNGANILRVHDVKEAIECVKLFNQI